MQMKVANCTFLKMPSASQPTVNYCDQIVKKKLYIYIYIYIYCFKSV